MNCIKCFFLIACVCCFYVAAAQNYQAINGSAFGGSLGVQNNPASIVHVPFSWDITPFAVQAKHSTNAIIINKYSLLSSPGNAEADVANGYKKRFAFANQDIRLFNTRISLNPRASIAFGANIRNYLCASTSKANYIDTIFSLAEFMKNNVGHQPLSGQFTGSTWAEVYGTYAQTIAEDDRHIINAGVTVKVNRSIAGAYMVTSGLGYIPNGGNVPGYQLTTGNLQYGYSGNFDSIDSNKSTSANTNNFLRKTYTGVSADFGVEYILLANEEASDNEYAYETKFGISLMDIGTNKNTYGSQSRSVAAGKDGITDTLIEGKFSSPKSFADFNDSLATIAGGIKPINGNFFVNQPTRIILNADQHLQGNFFINAELTLPLIPLLAKNSLFIRDMNLLAITPRWEVSAFGAYLPVLINNRKQVWVGAAIKAGPFLFGLHNLANVFTKNKLQEGGFYFALTIRPGKKYSRQQTLPDDKLPRNSSRAVRCPRF